MKIKKNGKEPYRYSIVGYYSTSAYTLWQHLLRIIIKSREKDFRTHLNKINGWEWKRNRRPPESVRLFTICRELKLQYGSNFICV